MTRRRITYSADELAFIKTLAQLPREAVRAELEEVFGRRDVTVGHIKSLCVRNRWTTRERFSGAEDSQIRQRFPSMATEELAAIMGRSASGISQRARRLGVSKDPDYLATAGRIQRGERRGEATQFRKGDTPRNKGVKRPKGWAPGRMRESQFSKGTIPHRWRPIGSTRVIDGYEYTKVADHRNATWTMNWKVTHVLRWEAVHGKIPPKHCLKSIDGNRLNTDPSNWQLIERALLPLINGGKGSRLSYDEAPDDLKPTVLAVAKLRRAVIKRKAVRP